MINMWIVWDDDEGLVCITDEYDEAVKEYNKCKVGLQQLVNEDGEFRGNEQCVLARIERNFYSHDTGEAVPGKDGDTYFEWKEEVKPPDEIEQLRSALQKIYGLAKKDGVSKELDECYIIARKALGL